MPNAYLNTTINLVSEWNFIILNMLIGKTINMTSMMEVNPAEGRQQLNSTVHLIALVRCFFTTRLHCDFRLRHDSFVSSKKSGVP